MSEIQLLRYRLKEGKRDELYEWLEEVNSRRDEALDTLQAENVYSEAVFLERSWVRDCWWRAIW